MVHVIKKATLVITLLMLSACVDSMLERGSQKVTDITDERNGHSGGDTEGIPPGAVRFPKIIEREYIPRYELFSHVKCRAWRIEWPSYSNSYDAGLIPTVLAVDNGALNSFKFLNGTSPSNTYNATMSLYYENTLESANNMWDELDHSFDDEAISEMESVQFAKHDTEWPLSTIIDWVTERPTLFESYWPGIGDAEFTYAEGDFIQFKLTKANLYGGVRIVKMSPRIIEVYLAVPNNP